MPYVWTAFISLGILLLSLIGWQQHRPAPDDATTTMGQAPPTPTRTVVLVAPRPVSHADSVVTFAMSQLGSPYTYAGTTPQSGFDCSGFVMYVFGHFGVEVPHSTALLINAGRPVPREQARKGDIVVFTGTATTSATAGHAGIIVSEAGEPIRFIHASSDRRDSGVKISAVAGTGYERRFLGVRRVLTADGQPETALVTTPPVAKLEAVPVTLPVIVPPPLPKAVAKVSLRSGKKISRRKSAPKKSLTKRAVAAHRRPTLLDQPAKLAPKAHRRSGTPAKRKK